MQMREMRKVLGTVTIENVQAAGQYLNVRDNLQTNGANIQLWDNPSALSTQWNIRLVNGPRNTYTIENVNAVEKYVNVRDNQQTNGANIQLWEGPWYSANQWRIEPIEGAPNTYTIENVNAAGKYLNVAGNQQTNGANIQLWEGPWYSANQWRIHHVAVKCDAAHPENSDFKTKFKPCGTYMANCRHLEIIKANVDYPGSGDIGNVKHKNYIVQFDGKFGSAQERCVEVVVEGHSDWGGLWLSDDITTFDQFNCMGKCARGCGIGGKEDGAKDCLKHDVCAAYKTYITKQVPSGFCDEPDCGDEAAQAVFNCRRKGLGWGNPAICDAGASTYGLWSDINYIPGVIKGDCKQYEDWTKGQGIPRQSSNSIPGPRRRYRGNMLR
jgi:hypothetical protein